MSDDRLYIKGCYISNVEYKKGVEVVEFRNTNYWLCRFYWIFFIKKITKKRWIYVNILDTNKLSFLVVL